MILWLLIEKICGHSAVFQDGEYYQLLKTVEILGACRAQMIP